MKLSSILNIIIGVTILLFGFLSLYFFIIVSLKSGEQIAAERVILGLGITSLGAFFIMHGFHMLKAPNYIGVSLISFWFAAYSTAYDIRAFLNNEALSIHGIVYPIILFLISFVFAYLAVKRWRGDITSA